MPPTLLGDDVTDLATANHVPFVAALPGNVAAVGCLQFTPAVLSEKPASESYRY